MKEESEAPAAGRECRSHASVYCDQGVRCQICRDFDALADALAVFLEARATGNANHMKLAEYGARAALRATGYMASKASARSAPKAVISRGGGASLKGK